MNLISLLVYLVIIGALMYLVNNVIPMVGWMKTVINVVVIVAVCLWVLQGLGIHTGVYLR